MALTDRNREIAFQMFSEGATTERVARRIRASVPSVRALRANWTRSQSSSAATVAPRPRRRVSATASSNSTSNSAVGFSDPVVVRLRSTRLINAVKNGQQIQLVIDVK